jgi:hypothetical protein
MSKNLTETERKVWAVWNSLPDTLSRPVHVIAAELAMDPEDVAFIVYPAEQFGPWRRDDEPPPSTE